VSDFSFKFGTSRLTLSKSNEQVALRSVTGQADQVRSVASLCEGVCTGETHAGFQIVSLSGASIDSEDALNLMRLDSSISTGTHVYNTSGDGVPFIPTGEIFIKFSPKATKDECQKLIDQFALLVVETREDGSVIASVTKSSPNPIKVVIGLQQSKAIAIAEPDLATPAKLNAFNTPTDNMIERQWHLRNSGMVDGSTLGMLAGADARVIDAWEFLGGLGSYDVIVAVIDDGFDLEHPDLSGVGKLVAPWDFTRNSDNPRPGLPQFNVYHQKWTGDWHGTACAGVAVGNANGTGIVGSAPNAKLMPVRWGKSLGDAEIENWFNHVRLHGADVVSCSWGAKAKVYSLSSRQLAAISRCAKEGRNGKGCVIVFAAGNDDLDINDAERSVAGFAIHPDVIAVAASTSRDQKSDYSNHGKEISICAPSSGAGGRAIVTSDVMGTFLGNGITYEAGYAAGAYTSSFGGTSSSTPLVAGVAALMLSRNPDLTAAQVKSILEQTARKIGSSETYGDNGHSRLFGFGCVDAAAAVAAADSASRPTALARNDKMKVPRKVGRK
jgi:subtilisin family serine protease